MIVRHVVLFCATLFGLSAAAMAASPGQGEIGGLCFTDAPACTAGICDRSINLCVACGMPGEPACIGADGAPECRLPSWDNRPVQMMNGQVYCAQDTNDVPLDCGHVGFLSCDYEDGATCYYGVLMPQRRPVGPGICVECGDYGQPCCENTDLACDYGTCQGGICLPPRSGGGVSGQMPPRYTPKTPSTPTQPPATPAPAPTSTHPCLDPNRPRGAYVLSYQVGLGGGGVSYPVKDNFICDFEGDFAVLQGGDLVSYVCDREANSYVNCREKWRVKVSSHQPVKDGYVYRWRNDKSFLVVHPAK